MAELEQTFQTLRLPLILLGGHTDHSVPFKQPKFKTFRMLIVLLRVFPLQRGSSVDKYLPICLFHDTRFWRQRLQ